MPVYPGALHWRFRDNAETPMTRSAFELSRWRGECCISGGVGCGWI